ncbi:anaerobic sulfatase maturase [Ferroplasma sp.]|uniref:anaerobic sulfatase maturase n=1 Tax=Ferroplasma sp. TaxID=2591003 RepID=UPI002602DD5D|nr:anaerobic sulfatase maturase [Ferroplasma sp.]
MFKTVSENCNLACDYCYYSRKKNSLNTVKHLQIEKLEKLIRDYMKNFEDVAIFIWQGGEPLLAGLDFFKKAISLESKYAPIDKSIINVVQTNGTLINQRWAKFFKEYNFLVGISLDGTQKIHDARRTYSNGLGSFDDIMKGIKLLEIYGVDYNILSVIHKGNVQKFNEIMDFFEGNNLRWIQFLPAMKFNSHDSNTPAKYEVTSTEYGQFLCESFDRWYREFIELGIPQFSIRFIDNVLSTYINENPNYCIINKECSGTLIVEQNGDVFPCDFFIEEQWKLGNISSNSLENLIRSINYQKFKHLKPNLPNKCVSCKWKYKCYGGCPRNRKYVNNKIDVDYFCDAYIKFYEYTEERMKFLANIIKREEKSV